MSRGPAVTVAADGESAGEVSADGVPVAAPRPRAIVFAYACEPGRGSEPGAGWAVVRALAAVADCTVLVGPEHAEGVRRWAEAHAGAMAGGISPRVRFVVVPEAPWPRPAGRGRFGWFVAYLRWMPNADGEARRLHAARPFDVACHASYSAYWLPTPATALDIPSVWGPVGGAVTTPLALWPALGARGIIAELVDRVAVRLFSRLPAVRRTWARATLPVVQNAETRDRLPAALRDRTFVLNHSLLAEVPPAPPTGARGREVLYASALESRKGPRLALRALAHATAEVRLVLAGDGPERRALERLAVRLGVAERVTFCGPVRRDAFFGLMDTAAAVVFTGLREEGGLALAEAMLRGAPVIVLANGGARTIAEAGTDPSRVVLVAPGTVDATARRLASAMTRFSRSPSAAIGPTLDQAGAVRRFGNAVRALASAATPAAGGGAR